MASPDQEDRRGPPREAAGRRFVPHVSNNPRTSLAVNAGPVIRTSRLVPAGFSFHSSVPTVAIAAIRNGGGYAKDLRGEVEVRRIRPLRRRSLVQPVATKMPADGL